MTLFPLGRGHWARGHDGGGHDAGRDCRWRGRQPGR
jgi:hypothetical protein